MTGTFLLPRIVEFCLTLSLTAAVISELQRSRNRRFVVPRVTRKSILSEVLAERSPTSHSNSKVSCRSNVWLVLMVDPVSFFYQYMRPITDLDAEIRTCESCVEGILCAMVLCCPFVWWLCMPYGLSRVHEEQYLSL